MHMEQTLEEHHSELLQDMVELYGFAEVLSMLSGYACGRADAAYRKHDMAGQKFYSEVERLVGAAGMQVYQLEQAR